MLPTLPQLLPGLCPHSVSRLSFDEPVRNVISWDIPRALTNPMESNEWRGVAEASLVCTLTPLQLRVGGWVSFQMSGPRYDLGLLDSENPENN